MRGFIAAGGLATLCLFGLVSDGSAETSQEMFDKLPALIHADASAKKAKGGAIADQAGREETQRLSQLSQIHDLLGSGNDAAAENLMAFVMGNDPGDALRAACQALVPQYRKERLEKETALNEEGEAAVQAACDQVLKADAPKDLDAVRRALAQWLEKREEAKTTGGRGDRTRQRVQGALSFVNRWQDYLAAHANGSDAHTLNDQLRAMLNGSGAEASLNLPIQRSAILALIKPDHPANGSTNASARTAAEIAAALNAALDRAKTLDDLPAVIKEVQSIRDDLAGGYNGANTNDINSALGALQILHQTHLELQAGLRTNLDLMSSRYDIGTRIAGGIESRLVPLRAQLVALELPRLLQAPAAEKPKPGETLDVFWRRLIDDAKNRGDWVSVAQGLDVGRTLVFTAELRGQGDAGRDLDTTGFKSMLAAFNFEKAGQYAEAVAAYLNALGSPVRDLPVDLIGEHLAAIQKDHPKDYEAVTRGSVIDEYGGKRYPARFYASPDPAQAPATPAAIPTQTPAVSPAPAKPTPSPTVVPTVIPAASP